MQHVVIDREESDECVPQGRLLGPFLFIIFINGIAAELDPDTSIHLFADDALLYRPMDTHEDHVKLQADLNKLQICYDQWGMQFNTEKCYVMHIMTPYQRKEAVSTPSQMQGVELEAVKNTEYLSATISDNLSWKAHNAAAAGKAHGMINFL